jgi:7-carboxy-7-deazaguanine synthase
MADDTTEKKVKKIPLVEAFGPTVQGEGYMVGERTAFLRFGLCDYECKMCDSMHAVDPKQVKANAKWLTPQEIVEDELLPTISRGFFPTCEWITFSGGNPCIHDLTEVIMRIRGLDITHGNYRIAVETQGTLLPEWLHQCDVITVSPKSPGMGEKFEPEKFARFIRTFMYHTGFNVKVVVFSMQDLEFLRVINDMVIGHAPWLRDRVYASLGNPFPPGLDHGLNSDNELKLRLLNEYKILTEDLLQIPELMNVKFLPQLHVLTWANLQKV